ncbi:MAG: cytochrome D1 domain-containing protein [Candidatus Kapaibacterium sp.]
MRSFLVCGGATRHRSLFAALMIVALASIPVLAQGSGPYRRSVVDQGIRVVLSIDHIDPGKPAGLFREGDDVRFRFTISDTASGKPVQGASPAAWMDPHRPEEEGSPKSCSEKVARFLGGSYLSRAELDLNVYYVLVMNDDATITVVDPLFGFGSTKLLALVQLASSGKDWAMTSREDRVFVSMPDSHAVAVVRTDSWKVEKNIDIVVAPYRTVLQPDGRYLWVGCDDGDAEHSGVAVIDVEAGRLAARIPTGRGHHDIVVDDEGRFAYVTNSVDGTISVIDARKLLKLRDLPAGARPVSISYSAVARAAYAVDEVSGDVTAVDGARDRSVGHIRSELGAVQIGFAPGGRFGFIVDPITNRIHILDASSNRIVQSGKVDSMPESVFFSAGLAYVRHAKSELILMIPLDQIGHEGEPIPVVDLPGGQHPAGTCAHPTLAAGIVQAPGDNAVLIANPLDKAVYYYTEGMAAPIGSFSNYGREARAVQVVDRSLRERSPGVYETIAKLGHSGPYDIPFFLDAPRLIHCFDMAIEGDSAIERQRARKIVGPLAVEHLTKGSMVPAGTEFTLRFRLTDIATGKPVVGANDVTLVSVLSPGTRRSDAPATETAEPGIYQVTMRLSQPGAYYLYVGCQSHGLTIDNPQFRVLDVTRSIISQEQHESR